LLLLLGRRLGCLLLGRFVGTPLFCSPNHSPRRSAGTRSFACFVVSYRSYRGAPSCAPGSTLYPASFLLLGIVGGRLLLGFLLFLRFSCRWWSLRVNPGLLFG
jgi:hypothetical protein